MKIYILIISLLLLTACTTSIVEEDKNISLPENKQITIHTLENPYGDSTCPTKIRESYIQIKMNKIVSGNLTSKETIGCSTPQEKECTGYFDITGESNNKCWILECNVSSPSRPGNQPIITIENLPCDLIKLRTANNVINLEEKVSWEII